MAIKRLPRPRDPIALATLIGSIAAGKVAYAMEERKNAVAAELGQKGGASLGEALGNGVSSVGVGRSPIGRKRERADRLNLVGAYQ